MPIHRTVQIIVASVRDGRLCPVIAEWVAGVGREATGLDFARLDLRDGHLPTDDERNGPAKAEPYAQEHTRAWSDTIAGTNASVFAAPQDSRAIRPSLKTAIGRFCADRPDRRRTPMTFAKLDSGCGSP